MRFLALLKSVYVETPVADEIIWHKRLRAPWFARTIDGKIVAGPGQIWRRKRNGEWEYQQDDETFEDWLYHQ